MSEQYKWVHALPIACFVVGDDDRIVTANKFLHDLAGQELENKTLLESLRHIPLIRAIEKARKSKKNQELRLRFTLPFEREMDAHIHIQDNNDLIISFLDSTESLAIEKMKSDFIANVSHELRTPLSSLIGFIEIFINADKENSPIEKAQRQEFFETMQQQGARMLRLIDDLLALSKIEQSEYLRPSDQLNIGDILAEAKEIIASNHQHNLNAFADKKINITINIAENLPPILGKRDLLLQLFLNLLDNAIKYGEGRPVTITANHVDDAVIISVIDKGLGISKQHLPRITERFYRVDNNRSRHLGGTGLGLAIVKHIVSTHRGHLEVTSDLGKGSCFTITLPIRGNKS